MDVILKNLSKRFDTNYVLKNCNYHFESGKSYGIIGANGSGKSTLLKIISGYLSSSSGELVHRIEDKIVSRTEVYKELSFMAPYIDLVEDLDLKEMYTYHNSFKPLAISDFKSFREVLNYPKIKTGKYISNYSSGMKNRLKLALSILSDSELLLLDEPSSFLDEDGVDWFKGILRIFKQNKTLIIASNEKGDFDACDTVLEISEFQT